jgi:7-cyano-7-deazaguanine reductase
MTNKTISDYASVHLGKAGDGTIVNPYVTPKSIDSTLLVGIPRYLNRTQYNIDETNLRFVGLDVWNCYEVSFLLSNGMPVSGIIKLKYDAHSTNIVESKSLKLYLNSFNMEKFNTVDVTIAKTNLIDRIKNDLITILNTNNVYVDFNTGNNQSNFTRSEFQKLEDIVDFSQLEFTHYNEDPNILIDDTPKKIMVSSSLLRSNCRVTNQPDWGDIYIYMNGDSTPSNTSLLQYIISLRSENHFHEEICECVYTRLLDKFVPDELVVACLYTRRGGIDINPIRATSSYLVHKYFGDYVDTTKIFKTMRQ